MNEEERAAEADRLKELAIRQMVDFIDREDAVGVIIRTSVFVDHTLLKFIEVGLVDPTAIDLAELRYAVKVDLALALGLNRKLGPVLRAIGSVRNKVAHRLEFPITDEVIEAVVTSLPTGLDGIMRKSTTELEGEQKRAFTFGMIATTVGMLVLNGGEVLGD